MDISSMAFTNSYIFSVEVLAVIDSVVNDSVVAGGAVGAKEVANIEGTVVVTVGMAAVEVVAISLCLD